MDPVFVSPLLKIFLIIPFVYSAVYCILNFQTLTEAIESKNLPLPPVTLSSAIGIKILCSLAILLGIYASFSAFILALFTVLATLLFHDFWNYEGQEKDNELFWFTTNIGLIGGLLLLATM